MSQETSSKESSVVATLFQKAHAKAALLERVEEQFVTLSAQRTKLQDELRSLQSEINSELNRLIEPSSSSQSFSTKRSHMQAAA